MKLENQYQDIPVKDLMVNPENPRLMEEMDDELSAINYLLEDIPDRMKSLAQDIADKGVAYDPPLVRKEKGKWLVYDGNRRVACVKLLQNPSIAKNAVLQKFFERLSATHADSIPKFINCRIENDQKIINDILERRHAGGETGIGQMAWKPDEKENFLYRAGIPHKARFGTELSKLLKDKAVIKNGDRLKVSILDRLLSSEAAKNRVGLTFKGNKIGVVADETRVLRVLSRIIEDARSGNVNLNKAWSRESKKDYFSHLEKEGFLPVAANDLPVDGKSTSAPDKVDDKAGKVKKDKTYTRPHLIPEGVMFPFATLQDASRIKNIVAELQSDLYFVKHMNSIAVLFRVLVEMCIDYYVETRKITVKTKKHFPTMAEKFEACLSRMVEKSLLSDRDRRVLVKFAHPDQFLSIDTFHGYVHHRLAHPAQTDLIAMWDQLQSFVLTCLQPLKQDEKVA